MQDFVYAAVIRRLRCTSYPKRTMHETRPSFNRAWYRRRSTSFSLLRTTVRPSPPASSSPRTLICQTHDPLRGIYDAVYRPNKPPPPPSEPQRSSPLAPETKSEATAAHATTTTVVASTASFEVEDRATEHHREGIEADKTAKRNSHGHGAEVVWDDVEGAGETERGVTPFLPDERLTLEEAVWMYTTGGAIAAGVEDRLGVIRPGCLADLTILEVEGGGAALLKDPRSAPYALERKRCVPCSIRLLYLCSSSSGFSEPLHRRS